LIFSLQIVGLSLFKVITILTANTV